MKKHFILPGFWENKQILIPLLSLYKQNPIVFYDDILIDAVFGNFTHMIWDGGRPSNKTHFFSNLEDIQIIQHIYNDILNISMRFVCSNPLIETKDCFDKFSNLILSLCENEQNNIIIGNQILEQYIREKYPKYKFISSTTKCLQTDEQILKELQNDNYLYICLPYVKNYNINFLKSIPLDLRSKIELLVNEKCNIYCPIRKNHYFKISQTNYLYDHSYVNTFHCFNDTIKKRSETSIIPYQDLNNYINLNISHFKLEGRIGASQYVVLQDIITYVIKPQWQLQVFKTISEQANVFNLYNYQLENYKFIQ